MRDGMNRQDYIGAILEQIDSKQMQAEIEKELSSHIDDREEYYREIGYDSETAAEKALERMGSPEAAADGFSKVHKNYHRAVTILAAIASVFVILLFEFIVTLFCIYDSTMGAGIAEALFLMYIIGLSLLGKRRNSRIVCAVAIVDFIIMYGSYLYVMTIDRIYEICSRIVLKLACLLTLDFECLWAFWRVGGITVAPYLTYLSIAFYTAVFILLILVFVSVCMLKKPAYSLRTKRFTRRVFKAQKVIWLFIAATILILPLGHFDKNEGMTVKTNEWFDSVIIAQSDTPCQISEIPKEDIVTFNSNYDLVGSYIFYLDSPSGDAPKNIAYPDKFNHIFVFDEYNVEKKIGNKLTYKIEKFDIPCSFTKDYVYIEFVNSGASWVQDDNAYEFASDNPENWYEVESAGEISAAVDAYSQIEITVSKKSP